MLDNIFNEIYKISLLNLYVYTDCGIICYLCPHKKFQSYFLGTRIDKKIHLIEYDDMFSPIRFNLQQQACDYADWKKQVKSNVEKIGHTYLDSIYEPFCVLFTYANNNLYVTFRGTCNLKETSLDVQIFIKSHILGREPILDKLKHIVDTMYPFLSERICKYKSDYHLNNVIFSGHSLGSTICCLFVKKCMTPGYKLECLYDLESNKKKYFMCLFGNPSIGDPKFPEEVDTLLENNYINICNNDDIIVKFSSYFIPNLNNVIQYETINSSYIPIIGKFWSQSININLGNNILTYYNHPILRPKIVSDAFFSIFSHSIIKYVDIIHLFLSNYRTNKILIQNSDLSIKFNNIFQIFSEILSLPRYDDIVFNVKGGNNKSINKQKKFKKSKRLT